jgi:DNA/RNA endonuclease YhcR with UshA esterase domain
VKAKVVSVYFARSSNGSPTFINLGHAYPNPSRLTVLIWGRDRTNFPRAPERMFRRGATICAQGMVELYRGVPQLQVSTWDQAGRLLTS